MPCVAAPYARRSQRLTLALSCLAFACGGEEGARLANRLGMVTSPDTLLREIRRTELSVRAIPRALGVDDWAFRKGIRYGTILVDLEKGHAVELLPERNAECVSQWLKKNPGTEIISGDRGDFYINGATEGAPNATQVADRFHLVHNLREAIVRLLDKHANQVQLAVKNLREEFILSDPSRTLLINPTLQEPVSHLPRITSALLDKNGKDYMTRRLNFSIKEYRIAKLRNAWEFTVAP